MCILDWATGHDVMYFVQPILYWLYVSSQYCIDYMEYTNIHLSCRCDGWFYLTLMLLGNMYSSYLNFWLRPETSVFAGYYEHFRFGWVFTRVFGLLWVANGNENARLAKKSKLKLPNITMWRTKWTVNIKWVQPVVRTIWTPTLLWGLNCFYHGDCYQNTNFLF